MTSILGITQETICTRAHWSAIQDLAVGVQSTWTGLARIRGCDWVSQWVALSEGIAGESMIAEAHWVMNFTSTQCTNPTSTWAWISAFVSHTGLVHRTIIVYQAFVAVATCQRRWVPSHSLGAQARTVSIWTYNALGTWSTWIWLTH